MPFELHGKYYTLREIGKELGIPYEKLSGWLLRAKVEPLVVGALKLLTEEQYNIVKAEYEEKGQLVSQTNAAVELGISLYELQRGLQMGLPMKMNCSLRRIHRGMLKKIKKCPCFNKQKPDWPKIIGWLKTQDEEKAE